MSRAGSTRADLRNGLMATWCALWLVVGAWAGYEVWMLADLGSTVADSGRALDSAGSALQSLRAVPVVGDTTAEIGDEVRANAADIAARAVDARGSLRRLAVLLGMTIALVPSVPVLAVHLAVSRGHFAPTGR